MLRNANGTENMSPGNKIASRELNESSEVNLFTKYSLFISNFIFTVAGLVLAALSIWLLIEKSKQIYDSVDVIIDVSIFFCVAGFITALVSTIGCWGALRENTRFIIAYKYVVILLILSEVVLLTLIILYSTLPSLRDTLKLFPENSFLESMQQYANDKIKNDNTRYFVDNIHLSLECCGLSNSDEGYKDWGKVPEFRCYNNTNTYLTCSVPSTCCITKPGVRLDVFCGGGALQLSTIEANKKIYTRGCLKAFNEWVDDNGFVVAAVFISVIIPQVILLCLGNCLTDQIYRQKAKWYD